MQPHQLKIETQNQDGSWSELNLDELVLIRINKRYPR